MAKPRTPTAKALVAGADLTHAGRYKDRTGPKRARPVGDPYITMTQEQKAAWREYQVNMPWLMSSDRVLLRLACIWTARMDDRDFGVSATRALSAILSKLGATPVDASKVSHGGGDDPDPADRFFVPASRGAMTQ